MQSSFIIILALCVPFALLPMTPAFKCFNGRGVNSSGLLPRECKKMCMMTLLERDVPPNAATTPPADYIFGCTEDDCDGLVNQCRSYPYIGVICCCEGALCNGGDNIRQAAQQAESGPDDVTFANDDKKHGGKCDELVITNGKTVSAGVSYGESVDVCCDAGYHPTAAQVTCTNLGAFTAVRCEHRCILLIGGNHDPKAGPVEYYHPTEGVECDVAAIGNMSTMNVAKIARSSACFMSDSEKILIREATYLGDNPPMVYRLADSSATQLSPLYKYRGNVTLVSDTVTAAVNGSSCISCGGIFKNAGNGNYAYLRVCRQFDSLSSKWTPVEKRMPQMSAAAASILMGGKDFYVIGGSRGFGRSEDLNSLLRYNVTAQTWSTERSMNEKRMWHSAARLSATEFIVCGGYDKISSCEIYNTTANTWRCGGYMKVGRHEFQMFNFNGQVYALGGIGAGSQWGNTPLTEKYDQATNTWSIAKPLKHERYHFVAVVV